MKKYILTSLILLGCLTAQARERRLFDKGWLFLLADSVQMSRPDYNDKAWRRLDLPHDWSIEGDFMASNPAEAGGGALPGGIAWYRKHFRINPKERYDKYSIEFDGVYKNSTVYINGHKLGTRPYGFSSFAYDITPYLNRNGDNVVAVRVDNGDQPNLRWYSGSGIYRHVWFTKTANLHVGHWGTYVTTTGNRLNISVDIVNEGGKNVPLQLRNTVLDAEGKTVAQLTTAVRPFKGMAVEKQEITVKDAQLWSIDRPYLYKVKTELLVKGRVVDTYMTRTGFRTFEFDAKNGFSINGKPVKINGVCNHHDLGCLGAAIHEDAIYRQLKMLKDMGCNAIRCSHNPPAPELLDLCDEMGFIVMDEAFDVWHRKKTKNDYAKYFDEWFEKDLTDMVLRDRNHPSIFMWSIGNEVLEQWTTADADSMSLEQANLILNLGRDASNLAKEGEISVNSLLTIKLSDVVKKLDPTRPVTAGCNEPDPHNHLFKSGAVDIIGFNYHHQWIKDVPKNFPGKPFLMSESVSSVHTRGNYMMPSDSVIVGPKEWWMPFTNPTFMCSAYDNMRVAWGSTHEEMWDIVKHTPHCAGQFIWTGWDYIGEPTPYGFPAKSSYFGIIDLAGFPKDIYYMYQSEWTDRPVLHLFPHWNWLPGQTIDLWCYYNHADEVELYVNGKSQGIRRKEDSHQYHVMWRVIFEPGEVKVVARQGGKDVRSQVIRTAGSPYQIELTPDKTELQADGKSLSFVTVEVKDKDGNLCPWAEDRIFFHVDGQAEIVGVDNGSQASMERFKADNRKAFFGKCLVVLKSGEKPGNITLTARGINLKDATLKLNSR